jgi:hypothetical protein
MKPSAGSTKPGCQPATSAVAAVGAEADRAAGNVQPIIVAEIQWSGATTLRAIAEA